MRVPDRFASYSAELGQLLGFIITRVVVSPAMLLIYLADAPVTA